MKNNTIGKRIAEARINRNITQEHLEELSGLSVSTISRIETGKYMPTIENLLKLSEILDVGLDYFLYDLLPHNKDIQSPAIQDAISIMNQVGERQTEYIVKILKIYRPLIRIKYNYEKHFSDIEATIRKCFLFFSVSCLHFSLFSLFIRCITGEQINNQISGG